MFNFTKSGFVLGLMGPALLLSSCGETSDSRLKEAWNPINDPKQMDYSYLKNERDYELQFDQLPLSGALEKTPWSDNYYPTYKGGITYRWNKYATEVQKYSYPIQFTTNRLRYLSPAEKYDIFRGSKRMELTREERRRTQVMKTVPRSQQFDPDFKIPTWEGLCHAWAPATLLFDEPSAVELVGPSGVRVPFASSDIKALLTYFLHENDRFADVQFLGGRCEWDFAKLDEEVRKGKRSAEDVLALKNSSECRDTNAGAFHVVVANQLGRLNEGFIVDMTRDVEVWNQPVYSFASRVIESGLPVSEGASDEAATEVEIETELGYIVEVNESYHPNNEGSHASATFRYRLELNDKGAIVGGRWLEDGQTADRPDFLWKQNRPDFRGRFSQLKQIYEASIQRGAEARL